MADLDWSQCPAVESIPGKLSGAWVFRDTRMKVWLILLLVAGAGFGQTPTKKAPAKKAAAAKKEEAAPSKWPVETLTVEGNHSYTREQVLGVAGLKVGQMAGKAEFEAARDRLTATGMFETVGYKFEPGANKKGFVASFQVTEAEPAYAVRFEGLGVPDGEIEGALRAKDSLYSPAKLPATKLVIDRYTNWIQEFLAGKGLTEKIEGKVTPLGGEQFAIVFRPARNLPAVAQVTFQGNQVVTQGVLREAVHGMAIGSPYSESGFRELLNSTVRPVYEQRGRVRVAFPEVRAEPVSDVEGVHVFVKIDEGQSYELGKVEIAGPSPVDGAVLIKAGDFKTGDVANFERVNEGLEKIRKAVRRAGYLDAKVTSERGIDDAKKAVDVAVHIEAGAKYTMGKLTIVGLDLNGEAEITRIWTLKAGKTLNPEYPDYFLNRIKEEGLFEGLGATKADLKVDEKQHTADVTLTFTGEDPTKQPARRGGRGGRGGWRLAGRQGVFR
jgi:outer membrane protein assembly factor BamA